MKEEAIVIVSAARTPVGSFNGALSSVPAHTLGEVAIRAALERAGVDAGRCRRGHHGPGFDGWPGQIPARQAAVAAGVPVEATAFGVNQVCGSGLGRSRSARSRSPPAMPRSWLPAARRA